MRLLLTNDDGVNAKGIYTLARELEKHYELIVVAPNNQRSACGHSITVNEPLIAKEVKIEGIESKAYSVSGTPADCVRIGVEKLAAGKVDMVVSGINYGFNLGTDVVYSGTVSAAIEAAIYKIPSMAVSMEIRNGIEEYETAAKYALKILNKAKDNYIKDDVVLNVNVPLLDENHIKGIKVCKIGSRMYKNYFIEEVDEYNNKEYYLKAAIDDHDIEGTDLFYIKKGYVTLTPLHYDLTNFKILNEVKDIFMNNSI